jgi:two-component system sensor kinase
MERNRVLVVEDDGHLLSGIRDILELEAYNVLTAQNGQDGLAVLKADPNNPPDVIVSDIMMPHMNGFQFLEKVREEDRWVNVPFIFLTAKGERTDRRKGAEMGADQYLTKPFDAEDLLVAVSASLKRHRNIQEVHMEQMNDQKKKILTILNHEMRTPLTLVVAYADMLKEFDTQQTPVDEVQTFLQGVGSGADRLRRLIENFICVVDLDTGEAAKTIAWRTQLIQDLDIVLKDALRQLNYYSCEFKINVAPDLPDFVCDVQYITIAFRELMDNAAKFSKVGDAVYIEASCENNEIVIRISDSGRGIPEHEFEKIWLPFYQIDREQYEDQGSGSGLAIVKGLVELHRGHCEVQSVVDEGSTFSVYLPLKPPK